MTVRFSFQNTMRAVNSLMIAAAVAICTVVLVTSPSQASQPGQVWNVDLIDIKITPGAPLSLYNPRGDDDENLDVRVSGVVRTGLRQAMRGYFLGDRRTRMFVTVRSFRGISTGATLLVGGEMNGEIDVELRDPTTGEVLARSGGLTFSRVVASGIFGFGAMIAGGGSQERKYADEISKVSRGWFNSLDCLDASCTVARGIEAETTAIAEVEPESPTPLVVEAESEAPTPLVVLAEPDLAPDPLVEAAELEEPEAPVIALAEPEPVLTIDSTANEVPVETVAPVEPVPSEPIEIIAAISEPEPEPEIVIQEPTVSTEPIEVVASPELVDSDPVVAAISEENNLGRSAAPAVPEPVPAPRVVPIIAAPEPAPEPQPELVEVVPAAAPSEPSGQPGQGEAPSIAGLTQPVLAGAALSQPEAGDGLQVQPIARPVVEPEPAPDPNQVAVAPSAPDGGSDVAGFNSLTPEAPAAPEPAPQGILALLSPALAPIPAPIETPVLEAAPEPEPVAQTPAVLPLVNPARPIAKPQQISESDSVALVPEEPAPTVEPEDPAATSTVETRIAAVEPGAAGPTLANAQWIGFTPAIFGNGGSRPGLWIAGPFDRRQRTGWITDTATGATTRVTFVWSEAAPGTRALLSSEAARALGLAPGDVANVAVYLPR